MKWCAVEHHPDYNSSEVMVFGPFDTEEDCQVAIVELEKVFIRMGLTLIPVRLMHLVVE